MFNSVLSTHLNMEQETLLINQNYLRVKCIGQWESQIFSSTSKVYLKLIYENSSGDGESIVIVTLQDLH